jgi:hypothetical protein
MKAVFEAEYVEGISLGGCFFWYSNRKNAGTIA